MKLTETEIKFLQATTNGLKDVLTSNLKSNALVYKRLGGDALKKIDTDNLELCLSVLEKLEGELNES